MFEDLSQQFSTRELCGSQTEEKEHILCIGNENYRFVDWEEFKTFFISRSG
jgi:hypothetical protein